jgi:Icc-related predicted phosphoesterase
MGLLKRRGGPKDGPVLTLFHAADIHGADLCWRKFAGAGHFYGADAAILGGDMAGKAVIPVGSHAVRQIIEEYQPLLTLHGHIHESRGATTIGRTVCINPGSEYNSGRLLGVLVTVTDHEVRSRQFVAG